MKKYDYLIIGAGLYGAMAAHQATRQGKSCLVVEKSDFVGGFCHTEKRDGIDIHLFGAHIFRTDSKAVWDFVNSICEFEPFVNSPIARFHNEIYNLPFNMNTFHQLWGVNTPSEAEAMILRERKPCDFPNNLEEFVLDIAGKTIYDKLVKEYTEKQWGMPCSELPASTMSRIPLRMTYDNNYYREKYQGIPECGYTEFINRLLDGANVLTNVDYFESRKVLDALADNIVYTGPIDAYFGFCRGKLDYRSVTFKHEHFDSQNVQGNAVVNYTSLDVPYTRSIEHRLFLPNKKTRGSWVSYEYPCDYEDNGLPSYPILNKRNLDILKQYKEMASKLENVHFGGRLAEYKYYSMNDIIEKFICG